MDLPTPYLTHFKEKMKEEKQRKKWSRGARNRQSLAMKRAWITRRKNMQKNVQKNTPQKNTIRTEKVFKSEYKGYVIEPYYPVLLDDMNEIFYSVYKIVKIPKLLFGYRFEKKFIVTTTSAELAYKLIDKLEG